MQRFILNLNHINDDLAKNNTSYFYKQTLIPINSYYNLIISPYHENSSHIFRDIYKKNDFDKLINNTYSFKPISSKKYNKGAFYIDTMGKGKVINYEIIPRKVTIINPIESPFYISEIIFYSHENMHLFEPCLLLNNLFSKNAFLRIQFIAYKIKKFKDLYKYIYKPINNVVIDKLDNYCLDLSNFNVKYLINNCKLKKYFAINCVYV
tara:strand:+ start:1988 stop:2611 length:624 start_codon:yes stop_codon:yes gene_type:complete